MRRPRILIPTLILALAGSAAQGDSPATEPASRAWAIADVVLSRNVDPPTRQQMFLAGIKAVAKAGHDALPGGLARRASDLSTADQLASLLDETWASSRLVDREAREEAFFQGLLAIVPGEARLLSGKERKVEESFEANLYVGIQVALGLDEKAKRPVFHQILEGGPAEQSGARAGDVIDEIDGVSAEGMPLVQVINRLRGEEGTEVKVRFRRPESGEVFTRAMTRGRLFRPTIQGLRQHPDKRWDVRLDGPLPIGYLKFTEISGSTPRELRGFAERLESEGAKALVLDLRAVSMSRFHPTVLLADALLDGGVIGRVESPGGEKVYRAEPDALFRGWPMVVLANPNSSGEVAWLCEALRDNRKATILGNPVAYRDPFVTEIVSIPGGDWSVQMATGLLLRGDGKALARRQSKGFEGLASANPGDSDEWVESLARQADPSNPGHVEARISPLRVLNPSLEHFRNFLPNSSTASPVAIPADRRGVYRRQATQEDLDKAREILGEALKSAGK